MAELVAGFQYALASRNSDEKLLLFFVKFTDSAYRALEEYSKNAGRISERPKIQFVQNRGVLSFPVPHDQSSRPQVFNFSVSSNADEGTFECLQNKGSRALESFGALSHSLCIQAKEDVYEATKNRMAEVEEQQKKNRTQVISNETDSRRKLPGSANRSFPSAALPNKFRLMQPNPTTQHSRIVTNNHAQKPGNPELTARPIRERLIHLLALRPYKKPELYDRLLRDGISDKDRKLLPQLLSQVAKLGKDSTYHIVRGVWNDVLEDWPFYSEQDRQTLKRRKPQNLTPPGSSDTGSSGSGQSPTSTHPGSPPSVVQGAPKRPGYHETVDGIQSKRRRISHYVKPQVENYRPIENVRPPARTVTDNYQHEEDGEVSPVTLPNRPCGENQNVGFDDRRNRPPEEESRKKEERVYAAKTISDTKKSNIITSDLNKKPNNSYLGVEVKETTDVNNLSDGKLITNDKKLDEKVKRADSPAIVTSSEQQLENSKYDYSDTRTKYQNSDTIQENTVSASDTVSAPEPFPEDSYLKELPPIENNAQKRKYIKEYESCYPEYTDLHHSVNEIYKKLTEMVKERAKYEGSGDKIKDLNKRIVQEWKNCLPERKRFNELHNRLKRISKLVKEYDAR